MTEKTKKRLSNLEHEMLPRKTVHATLWDIYTTPEALALNWVQMYDDRRPWSVILDECRQSIADRGLTRQNVNTAFRDECIRKATCPMEQKKYRL